MNLNNIKLKTIRFFLPATNYKLQTRKGFSLVEVLLATSVFALFVVAFSGAYLYGEESTMMAGNLSRAVMLAEEGLEATRNIRDAGFANLLDGTTGLGIVASQWTQTGTSDKSDIFNRTINVSTIDENRKQIVSNVNWQQNVSRTGNVALITYLTNWQREVVVASSSEASTTPAVEVPPVVETPPAP